MSDPDERLAAAFAELAERLGPGEALDDNPGGPLPAGRAGGLRGAAGAGRLDDIRRGLLPADWTDALRAAAVARLFDEKTYHSVIKDFAGDNPPGLTHLLQRGAVEEIAGHHLYYQVPEAYRAGYLLSWLSEGGSTRLPDRFVELERRLSEHWRSRGKPAEQVRHLMLADPAATAVLFDELFFASDAKRDFTRCQDLTNVLADPDRVTVAKRSILKLAESRAGY